MAKIAEEIPSFLSFLDKLLTKIKHRQHYQHYIIMLAYSDKKVFGKIFFQNYARTSELR